MLAAMLLNSGCATIFFGTKNACPNPPRQVRVGSLIFDVLTGIVPLVIDFVDGAIYKPCDTQNKKDMKP